MTRAGLSHRNINIEEASNSSILLMSQEDTNTQVFYPSLGQAWYTRANTKLYKLQVPGLYNWPSGDFNHTWLYKKDGERHCGTEVWRSGSQCPLKDFNTRGFLLAGVWAGLCCWGVWQIEIWLKACGWRTIFWENKRRISLAIYLWSPDSYRGSELTLSMHSQGSLKHRAPKEDGFHPGEAEDEREALTLVLWLNSWETGPGTSHPFKMKGNGLCCSLLVWVRGNFWNRSRLAPSLKMEEIQQTAWGMEQTAEAV